jgi:hypothetical protein
MDGCSIPSKRPISSAAFRMLRNLPTETCVPSRKWGRWRKLLASHTAKTRWTGSPTPRAMRLHQRPEAEFGKWRVDTGRNGIVSAVPRLTGGVCERTAAERLACSLRHCTLGGWVYEATSTSRSRMQPRLRSAAEILEDFDLPKDGPHHRRLVDGFQARLPKHYLLRDRGITETGTRFGTSWRPHQIATSLF